MPWLFNVYLIGYINKVILQYYYNYKIKLFSSHKHFFLFFTKYYEWPKTIFENVSFAPPRGGHQYHLTYQLNWRNRFPPKSFYKNNFSYNSQWKCSNRPFIHSLLKIGFLVKKERMLLINCKEYKNVSVIVGAMHKMICNAKWDCYFDRALSLGQS